MNYEHFTEISRSWSAWPWKYFQPKEIACRGTGALLVNSQALDRLDLLRSTLGRPLTVSSAFRSPYWNAQVGGKPASRHLTGEAFDLLLVEHDRDLLKRLAGEVGFVGFGHYRTFLHIDLGPSREWGKWDA